VRAQQNDWIFRRAVQDLHVQIIEVAGEHARTGERGACEALEKLPAKDIDRDQSAPQKALMRIFLAAKAPTSILTSRSMAASATCELHECYMSRVSKQKCDMAADVAAVVHSLMPDVIADMEIEAGDDPTEAEKLTPMMPVSSLPKEPKKKTAKSKPKHPEEPTRATAAAIQPAAAKAASKRPQPPIPVTSTVTKGGRTVKPNSLVNFEPT
jgi:hypothetical protein